MSNFTLTPNKDNEKSPGEGKEQVKEAEIKVSSFNLESTADNTAEII